MKKYLLVIISLCGFLVCADDMQEKTACSSQTLKLGFSGSTDHYHTAVELEKVCDDSWQAPFDSSKQRDQRFYVLIKVDATSFQRIEDLVRRNMQKNSSFPDGQRISATFTQKIVTEQEMPSLFSSPLAEGVKLLKRITPLIKNTDAQTFFEQLFIPHMLSQWH